MSIESELIAALRIEGMFGSGRDQDNPSMPCTPEISKMTLQEIKEAKQKGVYVPPLEERVDPDTGYATYHIKTR